MNEEQPDSRPDDSDDGDSTETTIATIFGRGSLYTLAFAAQSIIAFLFTPLITRILGPAQYGTLAAVFAFAQVLQIVAGLGLSSGIQRHYADESGDSESRGIVLAGTILGLAIVLIAFVSIPLWAPPLGFSGSHAAVGFGVWWAGFYATSITVTALLRSQDRLLTFTGVTLVQSVGGQLIGLAMMIVGKPNAAYYLAGLLIGQAIGLTIGLVAVNPGREGLRQWTAVRHIALFSLPLVPHMLAGIVLNAGDRIVIRRQLGLDAVGRYQLAYNAAGVVLMLLNVLNQAWEPHIYSVTNEHTRRLVLARSRDILYVLQIFLLTSLALLAPIILHILAPASFRTGSLLVVFALVSISAIPYTTYLADVRLLLAIRHTGHLAWATPICATINIFLNILLIPSFGIAGSAIATLLAYGLLALSVRLMSRRKGGIPGPRLRLKAGLLLTCAISLGLAAWNTTSPLSYFVRLGGGLVFGLWTIAILHEVMASPEGRVKTRSLALVLALPFSLLDSEPLPADE